MQSPHIHVGLSRSNSDRPTPTCQPGIDESADVLVARLTGFPKIAQLVKADVGLEVAFAEAGGWDTHVNQGSSAGQLGTRLDDFGRGIAALVRDLGDRMADIVILTMSEFGRAVAENGNRGTDHGHGNAMFVIGGQSVRGGKVYGKWPGLAREQRYDGRDLAVTTDFRTVFAEIVRAHLGVTETKTIFPGFNGAQALGVIG